MGGRDMIARLSLAFFRMHERRLCAMTDIVQLTTDMRGLQARLRAPHTIQCHLAGLPPEPAVRVS